MEVLRKFGLWAASAVIAIAAIAVYFVAVPPLAAQNKIKKATILQSRDSLGRWAKSPTTIPNEAKVTEALRVGKEITLQLDECRRFLDRQPRRCETRTFLEDEHAEPPVEIPADRPAAWRVAYVKNNAELRKQLDDAGFGGAFPIQTLESEWGATTPTPQQITAAMELFWFQKDLADFLTEQVEKDLAAYLTLKAAGRAEAFPAKPADLVINRRPGRLDELLRSKSRKQLAAILSAIVVNTDQRDLAMIFDEYLPDEGAGEPTADNGFPWERKEGEEEKPSVLGLTMDEAQKNFLNEMLPPGQEDLTDHQRFTNYIIELRSVRYREDVIGLLESQKNFEELARSLRKDTEEEYGRILADFGKEDLWSATRLAQAISAIVSIKDEKDYYLVRNNHSQNIVGLGSVSVNFAGGIGEATTGGGATHAARRARGEDSDEIGPRRRGGGAPSAPVPKPGQVSAASNALYRVHGFGLRVEIDFRRIPVFLRRLLSNSWRYRVQFSSVEPVEGAATPADLRLSRGGSLPLPGRETAPPAPAGPSAPEAGPGVVEAGHYVWIDMQCEGYQFTLPPAPAQPAGAVPPAPPRRTP